ncbi:cytochrome P450 [Mycena floridula]|nr:cytochrome P450 [Mycena floridula]
MFLSLLVSSLLAASVFVLFRRSRFRLPPGMRPKLLEGNLHQISPTQPWQTFLHWSQELASPVISYRIFTRRTIVLNTVEAVSDLLNLRSGLYSARPLQIMHDELVGRKLSLFSISHTELRFKKYRKLVQSGLNPRAVHTYSYILEQELGILLQSLSESPDRFVSHLRRNAGGIILAVTYGWSVKSDHDSLVELFQDAIAIQSETTAPGRWLVDSFPLLRFVPQWFPGGSFKRSAARYRERFSQIQDKPFYWAKEQIASGNFIESFTSRQLCEPNPEEEEVIKWASSALYAGGADTGVAALSSFILFMVLHPEIQHKIQLELDSQCSGRLPTVDDLGNLSYLLAVVKETLRFAPVAPLGLPHQLIEDDEYLGFYLPEGCTVLANIWALMRDPAVYPDAELFIPDRFIAPNDQMDPRNLAFGFGLRRCPGLHLAETSLLLNAAGILAAFTIAKPLDEHGVEYEPKMDFFVRAVVNHPKPFKCRFIPRMPALLAVS